MKEYLARLVCLPRKLIEFLVLQDTLKQNEYFVGARGDIIVTGRFIAKSFGASKIELLIAHMDKSTSQKHVLRYPSKNAKKIVVSNHPT